MGKYVYVGGWVFVYFLFCVCACIYVSSMLMHMPAPSTCACVHKINGVCNGVLRSQHKHHVLVPSLVCRGQTLSHAW